MAPAYNILVWKTCLKKVFPLALLKYLIGMCDIENETFVFFFFFRFVRYV